MYTCKSRRKQAALLSSAWQLDPLIIKDGGEQSQKSQFVDMKDGQPEA